MIYPHLLSVYSVEYGQDSSGGAVRATYLQSSDVPCFFQPAPSVNKKPTLKTDLEQELGKVFLQDGAEWEAIPIDWLVEIDNTTYRVTGKKNLCGLDIVYRLDVTEDVTGEV